MDLPEVNARVKALARRPVRRHRSPGSVREGVRVLSGAARFTDPRTLEVTLGAGGSETVAFDVALVATGASPRVVPGAEPDGERILSWRQVYDLPELPDRLVVVGLGRHRRGVRQRLPGARLARRRWSARGTGCCPGRTPTPPP